MGKGIQKYKGSPIHCPKMLSHRRLKIGQNFTHPQYSVSSPAYRTRSKRHYVAPHSESKWTGIVFVCSSHSKPQKDFNLAMASLRAALSGNASSYLVIVS